MISVIFDLDQTLIDSSSATVHRDSRKWANVYPLIPSFKTYDGISEALEYLSENSIPYAVVTSSPNTYAKQVCVHWGIKDQHMVCYHDTSRRKPYPDPIELAVKNMKATIAETISFGDRDIDIIASKRAGVISVACMWHCEDPESIKAANPDYIIETPDEIIPLIKKLSKS